MGRVKFDVGGVCFVIERSFLDAGPVSRLTRMCANEENSSKDGIYIINRPSELFGAILTLYLTGDLHIPMTSCPGAFLKELEFWEIDPKFLSNCCLYRLELFKEEQNRLAKLHKHINPKPDEARLELFPCTSLAGQRTMIWSVIEYSGQTILNKLYFVLVCFMILLSILTISFGTCDTFRRNMTNCERLEYMKAAEMEHFDLFAALMDRHDCDNTTLPDFTNGTQVVTTGYIDYGVVYSDTYDIEYELVNVPDPDKVSDITMSSIPPTHWMKIKIPHMNVPIRAIVALDILTLVFFTVDFTLRLVSCPNLLSYFMSVINIADALALFGSYVHLIIEHVHREYKYVNEWVDLFALMLMLRSLRLFRIVRTLTAARVLLFTLSQSLKELAIALLFLIVGVCLYSSVLNIIEGKSDYFYDNRFAKIPEGWYWAVITMTTVGYGDIIPVTVPGKVIACCCAVSGVVMFALTVPVFANHFISLYRYANLRGFSMDSSTASRNEDLQIEHAPAVTTVISDTDVYTTSYAVGGQSRELYA